MCQGRGLEPAIAGIKQLYDSRRFSRFSPSRVQREAPINFRSAFNVIRLALCYTEARNRIGMIIGGGIFGLELGGDLFPRGKLICRDFS